MALVKLCQQHGWHYLLRVCGEHTCRRYLNGKLEKRWKRFEHIVLKPGSCWYGRAKIWQEETLVLTPMYNWLWLTLRDVARNVVK